MVKKNQRKYDREGHPDRELLVNVDPGEGIQDEKAGNGDQYGSSVIHVNRADEIALFPFELKPAVNTCIMHREGAAIERPHAATGAPQPQATPECRENSVRHVTQSLLHKTRPRRYCLP